MSTNWQAETDHWVADGLLEAEQQAAVLERLEALPTGNGLALGPLMTVLVAPAAFLLIGSAVALLAALVDPPKAAYDLLIGSSATVFVVVGGLLRFVPSVRPLARGVLAAAVPMATYVVMSLTYRQDPSVLTLLAALPALIGWGVGLLENSRAVAASGAVMTVVATVPAMFAVESQVDNLAVLVACVLALAASAVLAQGLPTRATVLQVGNPAWVALAVAALTMTEAFAGPWLTSLGLHDVWSTEKGLLVLGFGTLALGIGLAGRSGWTLVPSIGCIAFSTVWIAFTFGSFLGGAIALALVSLGLFVGAVMLWLLPWIRSGERGASTS